MIWFFEHNLWIYIDVPCWFISGRSLILDFLYLKKLRQRIDEKYPTSVRYDFGISIARLDVDNAYKNFELKSKLMKVSRTKILLQFWRPYSYFYNDPEFPDKEEIMLLRMKK